MRKLVVALAAFAMCGMASAEGVKVRIADANNPAAAPALYKALKKAARKACGETEPMYAYNPPSLQRECVADTLKVTLAKINSPVLLAYASDRGVRFAETKPKTAVAASE